VNHRGSTLVSVTGNATRNLPSDARGDSPWARRLAQPGWLLLPLRGFLGVTFVYAGLQKLANPGFFDPHNPISIAAQMRDFQHTSPIGPLVALVAHAPTLVGVMIALGELAVGVGVLIGLYTKAAAVAGALLALSFFLTVSWSTTPYYYGADIVFAFAWLTIAGFGDQGVFSLQTWLRGREAARSLAAGAHGRPQTSRGYHGRESVRGRSADSTPEFGARRAAALTAGAVLVLGGITAALGRAVGGTHNVADTTPAPRTPGAANPPTSPSTSTSGIAPVGDDESPATQAPATPTTNPAPTSGPTGAPTSQAPRTTATPTKLPGTPVATVAELPAGQGKPFTDPATGDPAWLVHTTGNQFVAFDAVCSHAGCTVDYNPGAGQFVCPCHGGMFDARTGAVLGGPPPTPLRPIPLKVINGQLRVMA